MPRKWLLTVLLVFTLAVPSLPSALAVTQPAEVPDRLPRFNSDWSYEQSARAAFNDWAGRIEQRPPVDPAAQAQTTAAWTVLIFVAADNNLEDAGLFDINEMELVGSSPDVNIVVEVDRSAEFTTADGNWAGGRRYYIQQDQNFDSITSPVVEDLGATNSGDANTIADFAIWGIQNYPAQKYMLVLWDHGGAWISHSSDDETGDDIDLPETAAALDRIVTETGIGQFEVVGFDMCLMAQLEVFQTVQPFARYSIAAEESEPGAGWFYTFLDEMVQDPSMDGGVVAGHVVDYFGNYFEQYQPGEQYYNLGAVDLSQSQAMLTAVEQFSNAVQANPGAALSPIADARNNTISYGGNDDPEYSDIWSSIDLYRFGELLSSISDDAQLQQASQGLLQAVDSFVIAEMHSDSLDGSHGLAIYFPRTPKFYDQYNLSTRYPAGIPSSMTPWLNFLNTFLGTATTTVSSAPEIAVNSVYPDVVSIHNPAVIALDVSGRDILQVNYAVEYHTAEGTRVVLDYDYLVSRSTTSTGADIVDWSNGVTSRTFTWDPEVPVLTDGTTTTYALIIPNQDNPDLGLVNGEYTSVQGGDPVQAQLIFDLNTRQATQLWGINETGSGALQPFEIRMQTGDQFRPLWLTMDENHELNGTDYGETLILNVDQPVSFMKVPAPSGTYSISFVAINVAGDKTLTASTFEVNNDGLDPELRGYTDLAYGVNFLYPASWLRPRFTPDGQRLFTADLATNTFMTLFPYTDVASAEETAQAVQNSWADLQDLQVLDQRSVEINSLPAYVIDYSYTDPDLGPRLGAVIAIYVPSQNVGYGFDLDAPADNQAPAQQALQALISSINFLEPQAVAESDWLTVTLADGTVSFPVPSTWVTETTNGWTVYGPADNNNIFVALAAAPATGQANDQIAQYWVDQLQALSNFTILASQAYYVGNHDWHLVTFTYVDDEGTEIGGAFFATSTGGQDYVFWLEAPNADFSTLYESTLSTVVDGFTFNQ